MWTYIYRIFLTGCVDQHLGLHYIITVFLITWCGHWGSCIRTKLGKYLDNRMARTCLVLVSMQVYITVAFWTHVFAARHCIHAGVHHRCVLNPRICCAALQQGMRQWRKPKTLEQKEIDSRADMPHLLGLNFCWWHTSVCECAKNVSIHRRLCNFHAIVTLLPLSECNCGLSSMMQY